MIDQDVVAKNELLKLYRAHNGKLSDKWTSYISAYDTLFSTYRDKPVRILEIGIQNGGSLEIWSKYFPKAERIVGCDNDPKCKNLVFDDPRISVVIGDANTPDAYEKICEISDHFDIVIDDGSHRSSDIIRSFARYFPLLTTGGLYVAEDLHCSYWRSFEGGFEAPYSSVNFFKRIADYVNREHWDSNGDPRNVLSDFAIYWGSEFDADSLTLIDEVRFRNSIATVSKGQPGANSLGNRIIAGKTATVDPASLNLHGTAIEMKEARSVSGLSRKARMNQASRMLNEPSRGSIVDQVSLAASAVNLPNHEFIIRSLPDDDNREAIVSLENQLRSERAKADVLARQLEAEREKLNTVVNELIYARRKAHRELKKLIVFKTLRALTNSVLPLPKRMMERMGRSAEKRNPRRNPFGDIVAPHALEMERAFEVPVEPQQVELPEPVQETTTIDSLEIPEVIEAVESQLLDLREPEPEAPVVDEYTLKLQALAQVRADNIDQIGERVAKVADGPLISVVMPVYDPSPELLAEAIESVIGQSYPNWEFCIADDKSTDPDVHAVLKKFVLQDNRIKVVFREENGHISRATNSAVDIARGDYIALLDHDDLLDQDALLHIAEVLAENSDAKVIYSDEDKVREDGSRYDPHFKPDWNRELLYGMNYVSHLGVYDARLVREVGGLRPGFEGAQDYDLLLRCVENIDESQIHHIPKVLYSWRATKGSTAESNEAKPYATETGRKALEEHLNNRLGEPIDVKAGPFPFSYVPQWKPKNDPLVSIIIPTRDYLKVLSTAVESIVEKTRYQNYEIIIIDNGSIEPETHSWCETICKKEPRIRILKDDRPFNYSALNNAAVAQANGSIIALLNNDIEIISPDWLDEMVGLAQQPDVGCVGAMLYYPSNAIQHAGVVIGIGGVAGHSHKHFVRGQYGYFSRLHFRQEYSAVTAACLVIRKDVFLEVGGLNEVDLVIAFNDVDLCLKVREAGYRNIWTPHAELYHHESVSRGYEVSPEKQKRFQSEISYMIDRWQTNTFRDPAYNPNLTLDREDFSLSASLFQG